MSLQPGRVGIGKLHLFFLLILVAVLFFNLAFWFFPSKLVHIAFSLLNWVWSHTCIWRGFPGGASGKELAWHAGSARGARLISGSGRSPGRGNGNPPVFLPGEFHGQRNLATTVRGVTKSWTWLRQLSAHDSDNHWIYICTAQQIRLYSFIYSFLYHLPIHYTNIYWRIYVFQHWTKSELIKKIKTFLKKWFWNLKIFLL